MYCNQPALAQRYFLAALRATHVSGDRAIGANVLGFMSIQMVPFFAPILMPVLSSVGAIAGWQMAVAVVLTVVAIGVMALVGGRVYANSVLRTGARVKLREAFRPTG